MNFHIAIKDEHELEQFMLNVDYFSHCKIIEMAYHCPSHLLEEGALDMSEESFLRILFFLQNAKFSAVDLFFEGVKKFRIGDNMDLNLTGYKRDNLFIIKSLDSENFYCEAKSIKFKTDIDKDVEATSPVFAYANPFLQKAVDILKEVVHDEKLKKYAEESNDIILLATEGKLKLAFELLFINIISDNLILENQSILPACVELGTYLGLNSDSQLSVNFWDDFLQWIKKQGSLGSNPNDA